LLSLKKLLEKDHSINVLPLSFDVQDKFAVQKAVDSLKGEWKNIDVLVNNAGLALGMSPIDEGNTEDWDTMIDTNIKGLLYVTRAVVPLMRDRRKGHIINIGSTAAKNNYRNGNIYAATKHAVEALSESMRIDLLPYAIKVTAVHPGAAETEFSMVRFRGDRQKAKDVYKGFEPLHGEDVAEVVYLTTTLPDHVCINDLVVTCTAQANAYYIHKVDS
jgi:NADP-dependent 3-hydroxy acid dehydrogenase YdfG